MDIKESLKNKFSKSLDKIKGSPIREFDAYASQFDDVIKLTIGEPDFDTCDVIKESVNKSLNNNRTHYSINNGIFELREEVSKMINEKYNTTYSSDEVIVTVGASAGIEHTISALTNPDDTILVVTPYFTMYDACSILNNCNVGYIDTLETDFKLTPQLFEENYKKYKNVKAIVFNYPNNPTGVSYTKDELEKLAETFKKYDIFIISDEIYSDLSYNYKHTSLVELIPEQTILITGLSKSHAMTGWRVGFVIAPQEAIRKISIYHIFTVSGIPTFIQDAAVIALKDINSKQYVQTMINTYIKRKEYIIPELKKLGFELKSVDGAFYAFARIPKKYRVMKDIEFCKFLVREAKVGIIPGSAFGSIYDEYVRISYATSMENLVECISRLSKILDN